MNVKTLVLCASAILCGGAAMVGVNRLNRPSATPSVESTPIIVASVDVPRGAMLTEEMVTLRDWPTGLAPTGAYQKVEDVVDQAVRYPLIAGEPVLQRKLAGEGSEADLASLVPKGMRAFTINTPHVAAGVGGFILPGNSVDILLTTTSSGVNDRTGGGATTTLLQNVKILAVAQHMNPPEDNNKVDPRDVGSVTLLVTPNQAAKLDLAMNRGILHLSLRNPEDIEDADTEAATMAQLRFHQEPPSDRLATMERVLGVVAKAASTMATVRPAAPPEPRATPKPARIRTLRGVSKGVVLVENR